LAFGFLGLSFQGYWVGRAARLEPRAKSLEPNFHVR
jgi:hypothetical protein